MPETGRRSRDSVGADEDAAGTYVIRGGTPIGGEITPKGNKNAALPMLAATGLSMILMNALDPVLMGIAGASHRIVSDAIFSWC